MPNYLDAITARAESGNRNFDRLGRPVRSPKGALFAMQVMPSTARDPGFGLRPANPSDPNDMNRLGREYRATMERRYGGDPAKMWAAYNAGPGRVDSALSRHGEGWLNAMPAETRNYVQNNLQQLGSPMLQPRKPRPQNMAAAQMPPAPPPVPHEAPLGIEALGSLIPQDAPLDPNMAGAMPQIKKGGLFGSGLGIGEILVHGLNGYLAGRGNQAGLNNMQMLAQHSQNEQDQSFAREKLAMQVEAERQERMAKANEMPDFVRDAQVFASLPQEMQANVARMYDVRSPNIVDVTRSDGSMIRQQVPRAIPGPPPEAVNELRAALSTGDNNAVAEFEEVFGPGSARRYMGQ